MPQEMMEFTATESIAAFRLLSLRSALKLEILGMTRKGSSACSIIKKEIDLKSGSRKVVLEKFETYLREKGVLKCKS